MEEHVVLVDENNKPLGTAPKSTVHTSKTPLHRGFSVFLFNSKGELLLQQRSSKKKTFPLIWSNSCCGHPGVGESSKKAARRRLKNELGITQTEIYEILPDYRYQAKMNGLVENEFCPVLVGFTSQTPQINQEEIEKIRWVKWEEFLQEITHKPENYSSWSVEETQLLQKNQTFKSFLKNLPKKIL